MKYFLSCCFTLCVLQSVAQGSYQRYLDATVRWTYEFSVGGLGFSYYEFTEYTVQGDTLIDSTLYWNVWARTRSTSNGVPNQSYRPVFGLRETPDKKFYQYPYNGTAEVLMNDFNLKLGDTLQSDVYGTFRVDYIDTIEFGNEKRLFFRSMFPCGVVEGIGFVARNGSFNDRLICFQNRQGLYPKSASLESCKFTETTAADEAFLPLELQAYPNPAQSDITIEFPPDLQNEPLYFRWYHVSGSLHSEGILNKVASKCMLSISNHTPGFYILLIGDKTRWIPLRVVVAR